MTPKEIQSERVDSPVVVLNADKLHPIINAHLLQSFIFVCVDLPNITPHS